MRIKFVVVFLVFLLVSCASQPTNFSENVPGFFLGFWHGFIAIFALVAGLFNDVRIYSFPNSGYLYDLGFVLGFLFFLFSLLCMAVVD